MKLSFFWLVVLTAFAGLGNAVAQPDNIHNWMQYAGTYRISPQWALNPTVQYRTHDAFTNLRVLFAGTDVQYSFKNAPISLLTGYAYLYNRRYVNAEDTEHDQENRLYQQISRRDNIGRVNVTHRYQVEERWLTQGFQVRFRYSTALRIPIGPAGQEHRPWFGILRNEIRVIVRDQPYDSNRIAGGVGYVFNDRLTLETSWMSQLGARSNHQHFTMFVLRHELNKLK